MKFFKITHLILGMAFLGIAMSCTTKTTDSESNEPSAPEAPENLTEVVEKETGVVYDQYQQTFVLSMISNMTGGKHKVQNWDNPEREAATKAFKENIKVVFDSVVTKEQMKGKQDPWRISWGPVVYVDPKDHFEKGGIKYFAATQAMYVANRGDDYVICIAGTNANSKVDLAEDSPISKKTPLAKEFLKYVSKYLDGKAKVTPGTNMALEFLEKLEDGPGNIAKYLNSIENEREATVTIAGHSLGGGLTPAMGVVLFHELSSFPHSGGLHKKFKERRLFPTAAPDIGTQAFVDAVRKLFPEQAVGDSAYQQWNQKIWSSHDIVPHAWAEKFLLEINTMFQDSIVVPGLVPCLIGAANGVLNKQKGKPYKVHPMASMDPDKKGQFKGKFKTLKEIKGYDPAKCSSFPATRLVFYPYFTEVLYQHVNHYYEYFRIHPSVLEPPSIDACAAAENI